MHDEYYEVYQIIDKLICEKFRCNSIYDLFMGPCDAMAELRKKFPKPTWEVTIDE